MRTIAGLIGATLLVLGGCSHAPTFERTDRASLVETAPLRPRAGVHLHASPGTDPRLARALDGALGRSDGLAPVASETAEYVVRVHVVRRADGSMASFLVCFPGFLVFAPAWHGLAWPYELESHVAIARGGERVASYRVVRRWTGHYTPPLRGALAGLGWVLPLYPISLQAAALSVVEPPDTAVLDRALIEQEGALWAEEVLRTVTAAIARDREAGSP